MFPLDSAGPNQPNDVGAESTKTRKLHLETSLKGDRPGFFKKYAEHGSPFDFQPDDEESEDVMDLNGVIQCYLFTVHLLGFKKILFLLSVWKF